MPSIARWVNNAQTPQPPGNPCLRLAHLFDYAHRFVRNCTVNQKFSEHPQPSMTDLFDHDSRPLVKSTQIPVFLREEGVHNAAIPASQSRHGRPRPLCPINLDLRTRSNGTLSRAVFLYRSTYLLAFRKTLFGPSIRPICEGPIGRRCGDGLGPGKWLGS